MVAPGADILAMNTANVFPLSAALPIRNIFQSSLLLLSCLLLRSPIAPRYPSLAVISGTAQTASPRTACVNGALRVSTASDFQHRRPAPPTSGPLLTRSLIPFSLLSLSPLILTQIR
jgi:hypothetical protein